MPELASPAPMLVGKDLSPHTTVGVIWRQVEQRQSDSMLHFFSAGRWDSLGWQQAGEAILGIAEALVDHGIEFGDRVVMMAENRPEWILADFAIQLIGGITVPIYPTLTAEAAGEIVRDSGARLGIASSPHLADLRAARLEVISFENEIGNWMRRKPGAGIAAKVLERATRLRGEDVASVIYTSGTTGSPKGVVLTHGGMTTMAATGAKAFALGSDDVLLSFLPYSHVFERVEGLLAPLSVGATVWISRGASMLASDLAAARPTVMLVVPRVLEKIMAAVEDGVHQRGVVAGVAFGVARRAAWLSSKQTVFRPLGRLADRLILARLRTRLTGGRLRFMVSGGAPLRSDVERFFWSLELAVYQGWGLTESTAAATANRPGALRHGSVGRPLPGVEIRTETDGELLIKGPGVMREYFHRPDATAETLVDGWLRTGDIGSIDRDGFVTITDRKKDLIKTSTGKYVAPQPLEAELQRFRYIAAAVVVGDQRPYVVALIQPAWDEVRRALQTQGSPEELAGDRRVQDMVGGAIETINRRLSNFETIKRFRIVAGEFTEANGELTPSLKVRRRLVQHRYQRLIEEMYGEGTRTG